MVFNPLGEGLAILWDFIALFISLISVLMVVQLNAVIQKSGKVSTIVTRKLVHIFAGPVFIFTWLLFTGKIFSRYIALIVPILFVLQFIAIGTGKIKNESFVASMSRTGDPKELLGGTLYYAIIMVFMTILWFYVPSSSIENGNPTALFIIGCLSGGDGLADIIGRKYGGERKFGIGRSEKTLAGTLGMFCGSFLVSLVLILIFSLEVSNLNVILLLTPLLIISLIATIVEALSPKGIDNWTIFISVIVVILIISIFLPKFWPYSFFSF
ncbi:MAG: diacylglycerol/polyprenol kinase family protein [Candidatus Hermodarchaeota archaeon]